LDVAFGAIISSLFFAKVYGTSPSLISLFSLGLTVWLIYTADRLLDVWDAKGEVSSERHRFHKKNQNLLVGFLIITTIIDSGLIFFMPVLIIKRGLFLSLVVIGYVLFRRNLSVFKEFFVAVLYTAGVILPVVPSVLMSPYELMPLLQFFLIALLNLIIFSWYEKESDLKDNQDSIATNIGESTLRTILLALFLVTLAISFNLFLFTHEYFVSAVLLVMTLTHLLIFLWKKLFERNYLYRIAGDAAFLFPLAYVLV
jgi:4-hydroxybenzoate polyprenyltransferase